MVDSLSLITGLRILVPAIYYLVAVCYVIEFIKMRPSHFTWTKPALITGILLHVLLFTLLYVWHGRLPYDTVFNGLLFVSLIVSVLYLGLEQFIGDIRYGAFLFPVNCILSMVAVFNLNITAKLPPALHSIYFIAHASLLFSAYACFLLSFAVSVMYLLQYRQIKNHHLGGLFKRLPALADMDAAVMRLDALGLGLLILGLATGFLWMEMAMGVPVRVMVKIGMSILIALAYLAEHLLRIGKGWNGQRACLISIAGFICVVLTILVGRHGY